MVSFQPKSTSGNMLQRNVLTFIVSQSNTIKMVPAETLMSFKETVDLRHILQNVKNSEMLSNNPSEDGTKFHSILNKEEEVKQRHN